MYSYTLIDEGNTALMCIYGTEDSFCIPLHNIIKDNKTLHGYTISCDILINKPVQQYMGSISNISEDPNIHFMHIHGDIQHGMGQVYNATIYIRKSIVREARLNG